MQPQCAAPHSSSPGSSRRRRCGSGGACCLRAWARLPSPCPPARQQPSPASRASNCRRWMCRRRLRSSRRAAGLCLMTRRRASSSRVSGVGAAGGLVGMRHACGAGTSDSLCREQLKACLRRGAFRRGAAAPHDPGAGNCHGPASSMRAAHRRPAPPCTRADLLRTLKERSEANRDARKKALEDKYCMRQVRLGGGGWAGEVAARGRQQALGSAGGAEGAGRGSQRASCSALLLNPHVPPKAGVARGTRSSLGAMPAPPRCRAQLVPTAHALRYRRSWAWVTAAGCASSPA